MMLGRNTDCIILGKHQNPWKECRVQELEKTMERARLLHYASSSLALDVFDHAARHHAAALRDCLRQQQFLHRIIFVSP
mgnify:CR=1 FL=1